MKIKENWMPLLLAALLGTSGGGGGAAVMLRQHDHPEIIAEIRKVSYNSEIFKLTVQIASMRDAGQGDTIEYTVAVAQLLKFNDMLTELDR